MAKFRQTWSHCRLSSTRTARRPVCHEHQNLVKSLALRAFITFSLLKRCSRFEAFTHTEGLFTFTYLQIKRNGRYCFFGCTKKCSKKLQRSIRVPLNSVTRLGDFFALWATIQSRWQQLFYPNGPHC